MNMASKVKSTSKLYSKKRATETKICCLNSLFARGTLGVVLLDAYFFEISINSFRKDIGVIYLEPRLIWESKELAGKDQQQENTYERAEISVA